MGPRSLFCFSLSLFITVKSRKMKRRDANGDCCQQSQISGNLAWNINVVDVYNGDLFNFPFYKMKRTSYLRKPAVTAPSNQSPRRSQPHPSPLYIVSSSAPSHTGGPSTVNIEFVKPRDNLGHRFSTLPPIAEQVENPHLLQQILDDAQEQQQLGDGEDQQLETKPPHFDQCGSNLIGGVGGRKNPRVMGALSGLLEPSPRVNKSKFNEDRSGGFLVQGRGNLIPEASLTRMRRPLPAIKPRIYKTGNSSDSNNLSSSSQYFHGKYSDSPDGTVLFSLKQMKLAISYSLV